MRRLSLTARLFFVYALFVGLSSWFVLRLVLVEIKPAVRQSTEETLVDTANLLAELVSEDLHAGTLSQGDLARVMGAYGKRSPAAEIWGIAKTGVTHRIYVTDAAGIVRLDSAGRDLGADFSRWNDVYLTLRGEYGARTTEEIPGDEASTVMYVAAPVRHGADIIGVVTVAKPNRSVQPFIERAQRRLVMIAAALIAGGLAIGAALSWWLSQAIRRLTRYADAVTAGERAQVPGLPGGELNQLAQALETMRAKLEGKDYVERYVQTLTHELKSPLAGIHGAAELLRTNLPVAQRDRLLDNVDAETARLQALSERLLHLAQVEQRRGLEEQVRIELMPLVAELLRGLDPRLSKSGLTASMDIDPGLAISGERFLVRQALANLLENAIDFTPAGRGVLVEGRQSPEGTLLRVFNEGEPIPDYALPRVTERFYSLPRPGSGRKSTGLGLAFVQEVAMLHGGSFRIGNREGGVEALFVFPHTIPTRSP